MLPFCPPDFQQYVILSVSFFLLAFIKVMNVFEMPQIVLTSPIPLCSGRLVRFEPLSPFLRGLFQLFNQQHCEQTESSWASPSVYGINQTFYCEVMWAQSFIYPTERVNEIFTMAAEDCFLQSHSFWNIKTLCPEGNFAFENRISLKKRFCEKATVCWQSFKVNHWALGWQRWLK